MSMLELVCKTSLKVEHVFDKVLSFAKKSDLAVRLAVE